MTRWLGRTPVATVARAVALLGLAFLLAWTIAPDRLMDLPGDGAPVKPVVALCVLLLGLALGGLVPRRVAAVPAVVVGVLAVERLFAGALGIPSVTYDVLFPDIWAQPPPVDNGQMALATALALLALVLGIAATKRPAAATSAAAVAFFFGYIPLLGHLYDVQSFHSLQTETAMALPTAAAVMALAVALMLQPGLPLARLLASSGTAGSLARQTLPWAVLGPPVVGWLRIAGQDLGWYGTRYGLALMVLAYASSTVLATFVGARTAARSERERERALDDLESLNAVLSERVAAAVQEAEAERDKLEIVLDATPAGIFETDPDGVPRYVNQRWRELAGLTAEEAAAGGWEGALHPEDRDGIVAQWTGCLRSGDPYHVRYRYLRPDGAVVWVDTAARAVRGPAGEIVRWLGSVTDVTDQVSAQARLAESERRYRSVVTTMSEGVVLQDATGAIVTANEAACRLLGLTMDELTSTGSLDPRWRAVREDGTDLDGRDHPGMVCLRTGRPVMGAVMGVHRGDGGLVWLMVNCEPLRDDAGGTADAPIGVVCTFADTTAAREAARSLERSEEQFRSAMTLAPIGMALVELDGRFRSVNPALCRIVGYEEAELVGQSFQQITHPEDLHADLDNVQSLLEGSMDDYTMEKRYLTRDGEVVWVLLAVSLARDVNGDPAYFVSQIQDITDARDAHQRLAHRALHDPLTGLPNRDLLMDRLAHSLARSSRSRTSTVVLFCDLDDFKRINDTYGHEAGDRYLVDVAERLRGVMRPGDTVARLGGDEFVVVAEGLPDGDAVQSLAQRVLQSLGEPWVTDNTPVSSAVSIGVALATAEDDARSVLREADAAMYRAKAHGRGRIELSRTLLRRPAVADRRGPALTREPAHHLA